MKLIGGWAEIRLAADFVALVDISSYQVFPMSYDAVPVFVTNHRSTGFEVYALLNWGKARPSNMTCAYRMIAPRRASSGG